MEALEQQASVATGVNVIVFTLAQEGSITHRVMDTVR